MEVRGNRTGEREGGGGCFRIQWLLQSLLTDTVILHTMFSGNGPPIFLSSLSRQVAISSINTHTSVCTDTSHSHIYM